jgi:hypothetical protein
MACIEHWAEVMAQPEQARWVAQMLTWEAAERSRRSLERRLREAHIGRFKPLADFDWAWPAADRPRRRRRPDDAGLRQGRQQRRLGRPQRRGQVHVRLQHRLPGGAGRAHGAVHHRRAVAGRTGRARQRLGLRRKLRQYAAPDVLIIDEVGYLSYSNRHADLLFELVSRRYQHKSTVVTTNKAFADWGEVFPNAACVVSLIDRLMHRAEVVRIDGDSYRAKEAQEREAQRLAARSAKAAPARPRKGASMSASPSAADIAASAAIGRARCTGRPSKRWPSPSACRPCARRCGPPTGPQMQQAWRDQLMPDRGRLSSIPTSRSDPSSRPRPPASATPPTPPFRACMQALLPLGRGHITANPRPHPNPPPRQRIAADLHQLSPDHRAAR